jgi:hypothetical protein
MSNNVTYRMINILVDNNMDKLSKLKKSELILFTKSLLKDYYHELDNTTIKELYNEAQ